MTQRVFDDRVLELARVLGGGPEGVLDLADVSDAEAETVIQVLDEVEAEERAAGIAATLRRQGHTL
jgi:hypothetical protein